jgi:hypothetical protein
MTLRARTTSLWSAVTCHRFHRFGDLSPKPGRAQRPAAEVVPRLALDSDQSPAENPAETSLDGEKWGFDEKTYIIDDFAYICLLARN